MAPDVRDENMKGYALRVYKPEIGRRVDKKSWNQVKSQPEIYETLESYKLAFRASNALSAGDIAQAEKLALTSLSGSTKSHPYMREVLFDVRLAQGDKKRAMKNLSYIERWQDASPALFERRIEHLMKQQQFEEALAAITLAEKTFGNESKFIIQKSIALSNIGKNEDAIATLEKCQSYSKHKESCALLKERII